MSFPHTDIRVDYMDTPFRRVLDFSSAGLPELPLLGWYHYTQARPDLPVHRHHQVLEICYMERGSQFFELENHPYHLRGGEVLVVPPGIPHSTGGQPSEPGILYWLNLALPRDQDRFLGLSPDEWKPLLEVLTALPHRHFQGNPEIKGYFDRILACYDSPYEPLRMLRIRHHLQALLLELIEQSNCPVQSPQRELIKRVVHWIETKPHEEFNLEDLARSTGLSLSQFKSLFKNQTGCSPRHYITRTKIHAACLALSRTDRSISQIAMELNFPTTQYFATVFRKYKGVTPSDFRASATVPLVASYRDADQQY